MRSRKFSVMVEKTYILSKEQVISHIHHFRIRIYTVKRNWHSDRMIPGMIEDN